MNNKRILFFINEDWFFYTHRLALARFLKGQGFQIHIISKFSKYEDFFKTEGFFVHNVNLDRKTNPILDLLRLKEIHKIVKDIQPFIIHNTTIKPVIYGSIIAKLSGIKNVVNGIPGLGFIYSDNSLKVKLLRVVTNFLYRIVFLLNRNSTYGIFENPDDKNKFIKYKIIKTNQAIVIRGMGCNIDKFNVVLDENKMPIIMMAGRLLKNKGIYYLIEAVKILKNRNIDCKLVLVGEPDLQNPNSITVEELKYYSNEGILEWWGRKENIHEILSLASIVALPTYYGEGLPKVLIEGAAVGRPLIATDIPGCREIVLNGITGFLVPPHDVNALAEAISVLIQNPELRKIMGLNGRKLVETSFSDEVVNKSTLKIYEKFVN